MDGARSMLGALRLISEPERTLALSTSNNQHLTAVLARGVELRDQCRHTDVQYLIRSYGYDKRTLAAFLLDVPGLTPDGYACLDDGTIIEDEQFRLLPGMTNPGWPRYSIVLYKAENPEVKISREQYCQLGWQERDKYDYIRSFTLGRLQVKSAPKLSIDSTDQVMMEELIRSLILIGDPEVNLRLLAATMPRSDDADENAELSDYSPELPLHGYREVVLAALNELAEQNGRPVEQINGRLSITPEQQERLRQLGCLAANDDPFQV